MVNDKQKYVDELRILVNQDALVERSRVEELKSRFYTAFNAEQEALKAAFERESEELGENREWHPSVDPAEVEFKELLNKDKQKRRVENERLEKEQQDNFVRKEAIVAQLEDMFREASTNVMGNLPKVKELQAQWKEIGSVAASKSQQLWAKYNQLLEKYYDLVKLNIDMRDLDFKKNLELKKVLIERAEKLKNNPSVIEAARELQQLHDEWKEIGPVARELREELWQKFKEISTSINKKRQAYFDDLHGKEKENLEKKQSIIDELSAMDFSTLKSIKQWEEQSKVVMELQEAWRKIGFAPKKNNASIYKKYRELCDRFFNQKNAFYKQVHAESSTNLRLKRELIEKAEQLKESTAWQETTNAMIKLQKEWKKVGAVPRKYADDLWKRFTNACDAFFEAKRKSGAEDSTNESDRNRLMRIYERIKQELQVAENNFLFFTAKSKGANALIDAMQEKIDSLRNKLNDIERRVEAMDKPTKKVEKTNDASQENVAEVLVEEPTEGKE